MTQLQNMLKRHEGFSRMIYKDTMGIWTGLCGRNVQDVGFSDDEIIYCLNNDIAARRFELAAAFPCFTLLDPIRQDALIDMSFMGIEAIAQFSKMWAALAQQNYVQAASEALTSKWAAQVGQRAIELAAMIRTGSYQD